MARRIQLRRDTATNWTSTNPTLAQGEIGIDITNNKLKIGTGTTAWNSLAYWDDKVTDFSSVATNIVPDTDNTRDLGSPTNQWRHVYTAGGSIYLDNIKLTNVAGKLRAVKVVNPGEENEAEDPDDSDAGSEIGGGAGDSLTSNDSINITVNSEDSSSYTWNFGQTGTLTAPGDIVVGGVDGGHIYIDSTESANTSVRWINMPLGEDTSLIRAYTGNPNDETELNRGRIQLAWQDNNRSGLRIISYDRTDSEDTDTSEWTFRGDGSLEFPDGTTQTTAYTGGGNANTGDFTFSEDTITNGDGLILSTNRGTLAMGTDMEVPGVAQHFHIAFDGSNSNPPASDLFLGDDNNYVKLPGYELNPTAQFGVEIGTNNRSLGPQNVEVNEVDELVPPGGVWRFFIDHDTYPNLGSAVSVGDTVTTSWGTPITATITDVVEEPGNYWKIHVAQDITAGFSGGDTVSFGASGLSYTWRFGTDGDLHIPPGKTIRDAMTGDDLLAGADLGSFTFDGNTIDVESGTDIYIETSEQGGPGESRLVLKPQEDDDGDNPTRIEGSYGVGIWANNTTSDQQKKWLFGTDGDLKLPAGGDIVDSEGNSVLGGGASDSNIWVQTFETQNGAPTDIVSLAISVEYDSAGNVIALFNHFNDDGGGSYYSVGKYTTTGAKIWTAKFDDEFYTDGWGLAVDNDSDSIYVAGKTDVEEQGNATLTKIDSTDGSVLWSKIYDFGFNSQSSVVDVASDGDPVMVGYASNGTDDYVATTKVDAADGSIIWSRALDGQADEEAYGMAVGPTGEVVAIGYMEQLGVTDAAATLYADPVSNANWTINQTGALAGALEFDVSFAAGVPTFANISDTEGGRTVDGTVATILGSALGGADGTDDMVVKVATLAANNTDDHMLVVKYNSAGSIQWQKAILFDEGFDCSGADADIDSDGNIYVTGSYEYSFDGGTTSALSILKLDGTGAKQWSRRVTGDCDTFGVSVVVGADDKLYLSGMTGNDANSKYTWVAAKYGIDGTVEWQRLIDNTTGWSFAGGIFFADGGGSNIAVKDGYVLLGGGFGDLPNGGEPQATVVQVSASGDVFSVGDWDFKAASFSGVLNGTASDITVVDAGKTDTDNAGNITTGTVTLTTEVSGFLIGTLYTEGGSDRLVSGANQLVLGSTGTLTLPQGGTITEGYVTSNPTIQLTPASPTVASQKLVIKGGGSYNYTDNGININYYVNTAQVGDTLTFSVYSDTYADQTLYWWIYPTDAGIGDSNSGTVALTGTGGEFTILIDSDAYEFTVRVSPEDNNYDPNNTGVESGLINASAPTFEGDHHLHLTTGDLSVTSIILGTDDHNVRTTVDGGISITTTRGTILLGNLAECAGGESHFHIMKDSPDIVDLFFGDDDNYVKLPSTQGVEIGANGSTWTFGTDGNLTVPGDILSEGNINIDINLSDSTLRRWTFSEGGDLTFPDNTVQTTAYTGGVVIPAASNSVFALGTDFTGTIIGDYGNGTGYIRVESNTGAPNFTPSPISTQFYNFLATLTAGTEFTVNTVVDGTTYNTVVSFTEFSGGDPVAPNRNDLYYTFVSGDTLPFSYNATALTLTFGGSTFSFTTSAVTFPDGTIQTTAYPGVTTVAKTGVLNDVGIPSILGGGMTGLGVADGTYGPFTRGGVTFEVTVSSGSISGYINISSTTSYAVNDTIGQLTSGDLGDTPGQTTTINVDAVDQGFTAIDLTKTINKLTDGNYTLADGVEGQIMYLVRSPETDSEIVIVVVDNPDGINPLRPFRTNAGFANINNTGICTLIFTDGTWKQTGGLWD